jgi:hypothetical protein
VTDGAQEPTGDPKHRTWPGDRAFVGDAAAGDLPAPWTSIYTFQAQVRGSRLSPRTFLPRGVGRGSI